VLACSALKPRYRTILGAGLPDVRFVALLAPPEVLAQRLTARRDHYAGPILLVSQLDDFELDAGVQVVDADRPVDVVVAGVLDALRSRPS
jgi:gluconokinase